jgi:hypothetical protein
MNGWAELHSEIDFSIILKPAVFLQIQLVSLHKDMGLLILFPSLHKT